MQHLSQAPFVAAVVQHGPDGRERVRPTVAAMVRNVTIVEHLGGATHDGIARMRRGRSPTVRRGPCEGDILPTDHMIPGSVAPELDNVVANLELMPLRVNQSKGKRS